MRGRFEQDYLYICVLSFGDHCGEICYIFIERHTVLLSIRLVGTTHLHNPRAEQQPLRMMSEDVGVETGKHLPRAVSANPGIEVADGAFGIGQMNTVLQKACPAAILVAIDNYRGANRRQAIGLRFHPIADRYQMLCDAVTQKRDELAVQYSHT